MFNINNKIQVAFMTTLPMETTVNRKQLKFIKGIIKALEEVHAIDKNSKIIYSDIINDIKSYQGHIVPLIEKLAPREAIKANKYYLTNMFIEFKHNELIKEVIKELVESEKTEDNLDVLNNETVCKLINKYFNNSGCTVSKLEELNRISIEKPNIEQLSVEQLSVEQLDFIKDVREAIDNAYDDDAYDTGTEYIVGSGCDSDIKDGEILSLMGTVGTINTMKDLFDNLSKNDNNASLIYYFAYKLTDYHNKLNHCKEEIDKPKIMTKDWPTIIWYQKYLCPDISHEFPYIKCTQDEISIDGEMVQGEMHSFVSDLEQYVKVLFDIKPLDAVANDL